MLKERRGAK